MQNFPSHFFRRFPFVSADHALVALRVVTALLFMAHAIARIVFWTIPDFGNFMDSQGFPGGVFWVWGITITEIVAGSLMIAGRFVRWAAAALFCIAAGGIVLIHRNFGWFVGEHGTGGSEYSVALIAMLLVTAALNRDRSTSNQFDSRRHS